jgi:hypothetical protein
MKVAVQDKDVPMKSLWMALLCLIPLAPARALTLKISDRDNLTAAQSRKLDQAIAITNQVINGPEFKSRVLAFKYLGKSGFAQANGLTNAQVYDILMSGAEIFPKKTGADQVADMLVTIYTPPWYKSFSSAVAFTSTSDAYLHIYNKYYNSSALSDLSATLMHEWTHKLGFDHDFNSTARRPFTVPYGVGTIVSDIVASALK